MATLPYFVFSPNSIISLIGLARGPDSDNYIERSVQSDAYRRELASILTRAHRPERALAALEPLLAGGADVFVYRCRPALFQVQRQPRPLAVPRSRPAAQRVCPGVRTRRFGRRGADARHLSRMDAEVQRERHDQFTAGVRRVSRRQRGRGLVRRF